MMRNIAKQTLVLLICCGLLSCGGTQKDNTNRINRSTLVKQGQVLSGKLINLAGNRWKVNQITNESYNNINKHLTGAIVTYQKSGSTAAIAQNGAKFENKKVEHPQKIDDLGRTSSYRKNRHFSKVKFNHYDRHLTTTKNDFSSEEFWASIAEF